MLLIYTSWKHQNTFRLYSTYRIWVSSEGLIDCTRESFVKFFEYFLVIVLLFFLAKEEYKVRYDEKEREAKDLNEKVTVIFFCYRKEVTLRVVVAKLYLE